MARAMSPDSPVSMDKLGPEAEAAGVPVPRVTADTQTKLAGGIERQVAAMPVTESRPGLTTPTDPGVAARSEAAARGMANIPAVGGYAPLQPALPKSLEEMLIRKLNSGGQGSGDLDKSIGIYNQIKHPGVAATAAYRDKMVGLKEREVKVKEDHPPQGRETPDEAAAKEEARDKVRQKSPLHQNYKVNADGSITWLPAGRPIHDNQPKPIQPKTTTKRNIGTRNNPIWVTTTEGADAAPKGGDPPPAGKEIIHTSDHDLTPEEAAALLKKLGK